VYIIVLEMHGHTNIKFGSHWTEFFLLKWINKKFSKICRENSSLIKIRQDWRALYMKKIINFSIISCSLLLVLRNVPDKLYRQNQITHHSSGTFFENLEIICKNSEQPGRPQMTIWRMRFACWIHQSTNAHISICNTYSFSTATLVARTCLSVTQFVYCLSFDCWLKI